MAPEHLTLEYVNTRTRKIRTWLLWLVVLCAFTKPVRAQESGVGFLRIGTNAAAMALGDASVALSSDAFSTYWNPAGLAAASNSVAASHHIWVREVRTYNLAGRLAVGTRGGLGVFATAAGSGNLPGDAASDPGGTPEIQFVNVGAAYGHSFGPTRAGLTLKYISDRNEIYRTSGVAADLGVQADLFRQALRLGMAMQNMGRVREASSIAAPLPAMLRIGVAAFPLRVLAGDGVSPLLNAFVTGEVSHDLTRERQAPGGYDRTHLHVGAGVEIFDLATVRAGYVSGYDFRSVSVGAGLSQGSFQVDYAFVPFDGGFGTGHVLSVMYRWE